MGLFSLLSTLYTLFLSLFCSRPRAVNSKIERGRFHGIDKLHDRGSRPHYDVAIVGAGPAGSTCAFYLAKQGVKVLLLEKEKFPRDKYCGDAVCKTAIEILQEMDLLDGLLKQNKAHVADAGGLVSPSGLSYIGRSKAELGAIPAAIACKRTVLDETLAKAAAAKGAELKEEHRVDAARFDKEKGLWTVDCTVNPAASSSSSPTSFSARVLVCSDGAPSSLATALGIVHGAPQGICSRAFVEGGTHYFNADGVVFYDRGMLPGYAALFRHPNDELNYCCYLIPGNPKVTNDTLHHWHHHLLNNHPFMKAALGENYKIERMRAAALRLGGVPVTTGDHVIVAGDAAGFIDPLTGEGIHHAMDSGRLAASTLCSAIEAGNYSSSALLNYHNQCQQAFASDFVWSTRICHVLYRFPILIDAATAAIHRKGNRFLARWADIMTGRIPKIELLHPSFVIVITFELFRLLFLKATGRVLSNPVVKKSAAHSHAN